MVLGLKVVNVSEQCALLGLKVVNVRKHFALWSFISGQCLDTKIDFVLSNIENCQRTIFNIQLSMSV